MTAPQSDRPNEISRRRLRIVPPDAQRPDRPGTYVVSALEIDPRATDETLLATALEEQRTIITEDKDFGELVFVRRLDHPCIIRFMEIPVEDKVAAMEDLIENHGNSMGMGALIVVTRSRVRIRHPEQD